MKLAEILPSSKLIEINLSGNKITDTVKEALENIINKDGYEIYIFAELQKL